MEEYIGGYKLYQGEYGPRYKSLIGQRFGMLTVIARGENKGKTPRWICKCDCGGYSLSMTGNLKSGISTSCGCQSSRKQRSGFIDLTGKRFGRLLVLEEAYTKNKRIYWKCLCDCGTICYVCGVELREGKTKSCGCLKSEMTTKRCLIDITGQRFGKLVVLYRVPTINGNWVTWRCQCDCGNIVDVPSCNLRYGYSTSCGCTTSKGEERILKILIEQKLSFEPQVKFPDLFGKKFPLRYDFGIYKNNCLLCLIEYNGEQHYRPIDIFGGEEGFKIRQEYDRLKANYCKDHNIPLIVIPYTDYDNLNCDFLLQLIKQNTGLQYKIN